MQLPEGRRAREIYLGGRRRLLVGHTAFRGILYILDVFPERAARGLVRRHLPGGLAFGDFRRADLHVERVLLGIDSDDIAVSDQRNRSALLRLGHHMADDEAVRAA